MSKETDWMVIRLNMRSMIDYGNCMGRNKWHGRWLHRTAKNFRGIPATVDSWSPNTTVRIDAEYQDHDAPKESMVPRAEIEHAVGENNNPKKIE